MKFATSRNQVIQWEPHREKGRWKEIHGHRHGGRGNPVELEHTVTQGMWEKVGALLKEAKKVEHWRTDAFELWCWRRLLRVPWTARRSNQSILKEINPEYSLEGLMLKLKLQYFGHLMQTDDSLEKGLMLGKIKGKRRGCQRIWMTSRMQWTWTWANSGDGEGHRLDGGDQQRCHPWGCKESDTTERLNNNGSGH